MNAISQPATFLHGFGQTKECMQPFASTYAQYFNISTSSVNSPDLIGHGSRSSESLPFPDAAHDQYRRSGNGIYVGYSFGGRLALQIALFYPQISQLILISSSPGIEDKDERLLRTQHDKNLANQIEKNGLSWFIPWWLEQPIFQELPHSLQFQEARKKNSAHGLSSSLRTCGTGIQPSLWEHLPLLHVPTLCVTGSLDTKFTEIAEEMQRRSPEHISHVVVKNGGHSVHLTHPDETLRAMQYWRKQKRLEF